MLLPLSPCVPARFPPGPRPSEDFGEPPPHLSSPHLLHSSSAKEASDQTLYLVQSASLLLTEKKDIMIQDKQAIVQKVSVSLFIAHLQIPDFIRDVFLRHAEIQTGLFHWLLGNEDAVVGESTGSNGI